MATRTCKQCGEEKEAIKGTWVTHKGSPIGKLCLACKAKASTVYLQDPLNLEKHRETVRNAKRQMRTTEAGRLRDNGYSTAYYATPTGKAKANAASALWAKNNPGKICCIVMRRHTKKLERTPKWLTADDWFLISEAYALSALRKKLTGVKHNVDHIVPLQGELVSGLHVPWNLRVIPARQNAEKGNKWVP